MLTTLAFIVGSLAVTPLKLESPWGSADGWSFQGDVKKETSHVTLAGPKAGEQGSIWTSEKVPFDEWTLEATIKTLADKNAQPGRSGLALWYTNSQLPLGSVHGGTDLWDGLSLMLDSLGTSAELRGHLNDGTFRAEASSNLEDDALSLCRLPYRDTISPITIRIGYGLGGFAVDVNSQKCFVSTEISLPRGFFGISADSAASSDQFIVERLEITNGISSDLSKLFLDKIKKPSSQSPETQGNPQAGSQAGGDKTVTEIHKMDSDEVTKPVLAAVNALKSDLQKDTVDLVSRVDSLQRQVVALENMVSQLGQSLGEKMGDQTLVAEIAKLRSHISQQTESIPSHISEHSEKLPSLWQIVVIVVIAQSVVFWAYNVYNQRKNRHQKLI